MRQIRETLRLHLQAGLSYSEVGRALKISKSVVGKYITLARVADVDCELAQTLSDEDLEARLYRPALSRSSHQLAPDFSVVHQELKRPGVTLMLLWEEYATAHPLAYKYTSFCVKYGRTAAVVLPTRTLDDAATDLPWVLVVRDRHAIKQFVTLGLRGDTRVEVLSGIAAGEGVLPVSKTGVKAGQRVRAQVQAVPPPAGERAAGKSPMAP